MKVIIAGGRDFEGDDTDVFLLQELDSMYKFTEVVSGECSGADLFGEQFAFWYGISVVKFIADWTKYGKSAGPIRNKQMAEYADAVILFQGGRGTANMRQEAKKAGIKILYDAENEA